MPLYILVNSDAILNRVGLFLDLPNVNRAWAITSPYWLKLLDKREWLVISSTGNFAVSLV